MLESSRHVVVEIDGVRFAESRRPRLLFETELPTRYYLPKLDVRMDLLERSSYQSRCPFKGVASYWSVTVKNKHYKDLVWCYETVVPQAPTVAGYVCFLNESIDIYVDQELQTRPKSPWSDFHTSVKKTKE